MDRTLFILRKQFISTTQVFAGLFIAFFVLYFVADLYEFCSNKRTYWKLIFEIIIFVLVVVYLYLFVKEMGVSFGE